jgi:hypothetical protein
MALLPLISTDQLAEWLGVEFDESEAQRAAAFITAASTAIRNETNKTYVNDDGDALEFGSDLTEDKVTTVAKIVAARVWNNPTGNIQETAGPFAETKGRDAAQVVYLTDADRKMLGKSTSLGIWTLDTTRGSLETDRCHPGPTDTTYLGVEPDGEPMPWDTP